MTRPHRLLLLQVALIISSTAAFSSLSRSGIRRRTNVLKMSTEDSSMSRLIDALQKMEVKSTSSQPPEAQTTAMYGGGGNDGMPVMNEEGIYQITSKEQHAYVMYKRCHALSISIHAKTLTHFILYS